MTVGSETPVGRESRDFVFRLPVGRGSWDFVSRLIGKRWKVQVFFVLFVAGQVAMGKEAANNVLERSRKINKLAGNRSER